MAQVIKENVRDFDTDHIFNCGQAFRWEKQGDGSYTGIAGSRIANIRFSPYSTGGDRGQLVISNATERDFDVFWKNYLDLDRDYGKIKGELAGNDPIIKNAIECGRGIRLLRQDKWETLLSFLISQNNHIPRIKKCIEALCRQFGKKAGRYEGKDYYALPGPETLAGLESEDLAECRLGYRARYLIDAAKKVRADGIDRLEAMGDPQVSSEDALAYITGFCGVGPKVANCILLFSMGKYNCFPVDVWMKKAMKELYGLESVKDIQHFACRAFGGYGGIAQQYLFYYIRESSRRP